MAISVQLVIYPIGYVLYREDLIYRAGYFKGLPKEEQDSSTIRNS